MNDPDSQARRFEALFRAHHRAVLGYALRRASPAVADDVVAETFLALWRRLDEVPDDAQPWLFGVSRTAFAVRIHRARRRLAARLAAPGPEPARAARIVKEAT